jgi:hypothetical protein
MMPLIAPRGPELALWTGVSQPVPVDDKLRGCELEGEHAVILMRRRISAEYMLGPTLVHIGVVVR